VTVRVERPAASTLRYGGAFQGRPDSFEEEEEEVYA